MKNNQILKIYGTAYQEMTMQLLEKAALAERLPDDRNAKIGLKPNLVSPTPASFGATTHTEVVAGIIAYLQEHGYHNLVIAEGAWVGARTSEAFRVCGYDTLARQYDVALLDAQKDGAHKTDCAGMDLTVCNCVEDIDFLINVPVLKGHCQTKITCALKNMKGLIPNSEKRRFHTLGLHKPIAHLGVGIHQDFIVVDHICGDLDFEDGGNPVVRNCVMAAADPVLVDAYVCQLLHYETKEVPYVLLAQQLGVGSADLSQAEILEYGDNEASSERLPLPRKVADVQDTVEEVDSCSACYACLIPALDRLKQEGLLEKLDTKICIGQGFRGKSGTLGIGHCTSRFSHTVKGCPPTETQIYAFLHDYITQEKKSDCAHPY